MYWTNEEEAYLKEIYKGRPQKEIAQMMNERFGTDRSWTSIKFKLRKLELVTGLDGKFKKGCVSCNKGRKGWHPTGVEKGWFTKGHQVNTRKPVGSLTLREKGMVMIKTAEPNTWKVWRRVVWEQHYGEIPKEHEIIQLDGDPWNCNIDNLMMVRRNTRSSYQRMKTDNAELNKTAVKIAEVKMAIKERKNDRK